MKKKNECPMCRQPGPSRPGESLRVTTALRDAIVGMFPELQQSDESRAALTTREDLVEKFSDLDQLRNASWFSDFSASFASRRESVVAALPTCRDSVEGASGSVEAVQDALRPGLERLMRRAGSLVESEQVYPVLVDAIKRAIAGCIDALPGPRAEADGPRAVLCDDVLTALARSQRAGVDRLPPALYGFGGFRGFRLVFAESLVRVLATVHPTLRMGGGAMCVISDMLSGVLRSMLAVAAEATELHLRLEGKKLTEVPAGAEDDGCELSADHTASVAVRPGGRRDGRRERGGGTMPIIGGASVREAVAAVFLGELRKHGASESCNAWARYSQSTPPESGVGAMAARAGLQVNRYVQLLIT